MNSIIQNDPTYCYIHQHFMKMHVPASDTHHVLHGNGRRRLADHDGLTVELCRKCHRRLHDLGLYDLELEQIAERAWIDYNKKTVEDFIKRYGKNYI